MATLESSDTGRILAQGRGSGVNKLLQMLVVVAILLSSVALVVALISLTQNGDTTMVTLTKQEGSNVKNDRIWNIRMGNGRSNYIYIDQTSGQLKGFIVDIVNAAWIPAHSRARTFKFSKSFSKPVDFRFAIKTGNPRGFNPTDVTNMKFGFVDGWINDEFCLARQTSIKGSTLPVSQMQHYNTYPDMLNAVLSGEVDVCISYGSASAALPPGLTELEDPVLDCSMDYSGGALMMRMDNPLLEWWDPALKRLMQTSEYWKICQDVKDEHGHMPGRDPKDVCIGY
ncbi:uncharacterized protein [Amphiura filiformis]|uniref:uncharacterized protein isoform X11 n=1 Tax=Amphiura filiformis TaxID=82378 RepID=UPI003B20E3AE